MPVGISDEHVALHEAVRGWAERHSPSDVVRSFLDAKSEETPAFWADLAAQGWIGLAVPEELGGEGYGLPEVVVVLEELGSTCTPGPYLASVLAAAVLADLDPSAPEVADALRALAAGTRIGSVALAGSLSSESGAGGELKVSGKLSPVLSGHLADVVVADVGGPLVLLERADFEARELPSMDLTRRVAELTVDAVVPVGRVLDGISIERARDLAAVLLSADAVGGSQWCVDTASEYAKDRRQFGRPIGQFQGVKHRCANMAARTELARAAVWDAARASTDPEMAPLTASAAAALAVESFFDTAKDCVQTLGGIGFTWEHNAHLYLRRAVATRALLGGASGWKLRAAQLAMSGTRRRLAVDLPEEAEAHRAEIVDFVESLHGLDQQAWRRRIADGGYISPQWPAPWGRDAGALEQLVIDEEFRRAKVQRPGIMVGAWALPPLMVYGTEEQRERWIPPTLRGEIFWCQLFSEPGAGSDLAALTTRAERIEGGWIVNGQKVWTSMAEQAQWGILLARTDPEAPKHEGISFFMLDMSTEGIEVRPLRELTGEAMFNEVFLNDVFVPDDCLVGREHDGWRATRTSLANERVFMGSGSTIGAGVRGILAMLRSAGREDDTAAMVEAGDLVVRDYALSVLGLRLTLSALTGADPAGGAASVKKLLGVEHDQRVQEVGLGLLGADGAVLEGSEVLWGRQFLFTRCLTIAGGTSEVQRNIIGERVLGLPRDP